MTQHNDSETPSSSREKFLAPLLIVVVVLAGWSGPGGFLSNTIVTLSKLVIAVCAFMLLSLAIPERLKTTLRNTQPMGRIAYWIGFIALIVFAIWIGELGQSVISGWLH